MNEIIDFEVRGNVVRFFTGRNGEQWGDDWNDAPYEYNAGRAYEEFVTGHFDVPFPFNWGVYQPSDGEMNSPYSKEHMRARQVPCIVVIRADAVPCDYGFRSAVVMDGAIRIYFGDTEEKVREMIR